MKEEGREGGRGEEGRGEGGREGGGREGGRRQVPLYLQLLTFPPDCDKWSQYLRHTTQCILRIITPRQLQHTAELKGHGHISLLHRHRESRQAPVPKTSPVSLHVWIRLHPLGGASGGREPEPRDVEDGEGVLKWCVRERAVEGGCFSWSGLNCVRGGVSWGVRETCRETIIIIALFTRGF